MSEQGFSAVAPGGGATSMQGVTGSDGRGAQEELRVEVQDSKVALAGSRGIPFCLETSEARRLASLLLKVADQIDAAAGGVKRTSVVHVVYDHPPAAAAPPRGLFSSPKDYEKSVNALREELGPRKRGAPPAGAAVGAGRPCEACNDTHRMRLGEREVPCTRCPTPCTLCRDGVSPYCANTPCSCSCHARKSKG